MAAEMERRAAELVHETRLSSMFIVTVDGNPNDPQTAEGVVRLVHEAIGAKLAKLVTVEKVTVVDSRVVTEWHGGGYSPSLVGIKRSER